uniref:C-terminal of Roc (COR) domain-containing protein n=1 Tax=Romanomermis culicivorax TaxID=13658 RepID=A0A915ILB1_ROMCU
PASYLALEEIVYQLANERKQNSQDPVLTAAYFKRQVQEMMKKQCGKQFRDVSELNQAASFLHDNGVLLHYDDATLKDLYFLDPQWLCDILAHVITIREINPFAKNGLMKTDDLKILFKSSKFSPSNIRNYILSLIQKFEVALTWDNRTLLIPSLLPDEYQLRGGYPDCEVRIPLRSRGWIVKSSRAQALRNNSQLNAALNRHGSDLESPADVSPQFMTKQHGVDGEFFEMSTLRSSKDEPTHDQFVPLFTLNRPKKTADELAAEFYVNFSSKSDACLRRLYVMAYVPSGFWSRLITRLLGDEILPNLFDEYFKSVPSPVSSAAMNIDFDLG